MTIRRVQHWMLFAMGAVATGLSAQTTSIRSNAPPVIPIVPAAPPALVAPAVPTPVSQTYVLSPNDVVEVKVYQEEDLQTKMRIAKDGTSSFPLIGVVNLGGKTLTQAAALIHDALAKDFLVNPQVTVTVVEYAKRRFTVLGQVQKPGTFEIPNEETVSLLQAIAMAGGYTRLANRSGVTVVRAAGGRKVTYKLDATSAGNDVDGKPFEILPEDTITIPERVF